MSGVTVALGTPNPRQREFLRCRKKYVAFGGVTYVAANAFADFDTITEVDFGDAMYELGRRSSSSCHRSSSPAASTRCTRSPTAPSPS